MTAWLNRINRPLKFTPWALASLLFIVPTARVVIANKQAIAIKETELAGVPDERAVMRPLA
ncbi:hypothetical protein [Pantoea sp. 1.19]|uniref:hypothetical protein n=1 Tax=Pantoea sp. 1.19 TaxID=1925589 RepID=UPI00111527F6|nr:hypothetical protein [Pantoea sp. 1.19]